LHMVADVSGVYGNTVGGDWSLGWIVFGWVE
jgi:hypothetical protein